MSEIPAAPSHCPGAGFRRVGAGIILSAGYYTATASAAGSDGVSADSRIHAVPIELVGATFYEAFLQVQLSGFQLFWDFRNAYNSPTPYVPGLTYPPSVQTFGVKWEFIN